MKQVLVLIVLGLIKVASANDIDIEVQGNDFEMNVLQSTGDNYLQGSVIGDGHSVTGTQSNGASAAFSLQSLTGAGGVNLDIQQNSPANSISIQEICTNPSGCSVIIDQR